MLKYFITAAAMMLGAVGSAQARDAFAPGPDIEIGLVGMALAATVAVAINRHRKKA